MRIVLTGCVKFSESMLSVLIENYEHLIVGIVSKSSSKINSDFHSLGPLANSLKIEYFNYDTKQDQLLSSWLKERRPDIHYCFGWSHLLNEEILSIPKIGTVGFHPALLPKNRGRHPIIWPLVKGELETGSTFFIIEQGTDDGDIISQRKIKIEYEDDANTMYKKITTIAKDQLIEITDHFISGNFTRIKQDHSKATYLRKRTSSDGKIDWNSNSLVIYNLVRAITHPYPGAYTEFGKEQISIWKVKELKHEGQEAPGYVIRVCDDKILVKCKDGAIELLSHEFTVLPKIGDILK